MGSLLVVEVAIQLPTEEHHGQLVSWVVVVLTCYSRGLSTSPVFSIGRGSIYSNALCSMAINGRSNRQVGKYYAAIPIRVHAFAGYKKPTEPGPCS